MKQFYKLHRLHNLFYAFSIFLIVVISSATLYAGTNNAFIITTVDNIKGQYILDLFSNVCDSETYEDYEFVRITGHKNLYRKGCLCEKVDQYAVYQPEKLLYKFSFWTEIDACSTPYVINNFQSGISGDVKVHTNTPEIDQKVTQKEDGLPSTLAEFTAELAVYPNPAKNFFVLDYQLREDDAVMMNLYDALGKEVPLYGNQLEQKPGNHSIKYDISDLSGGVYFYIIAINDQKTSGRLIISD